MFKPLTRSKPKTADRSSAGFAETQFLHLSEDEDYSGFAPTEMFADDDATPEMPAAQAAGATLAARAAASTSRSALERAAIAPARAPAAAPAAVDEPSIPQSWVTSQWVAAQEAKAHEAAHRARAVIEAQRRAEERAEVAEPVEAPGAPRTGLGRLRAAFERLLPGNFRSLLPLFIGVSVTMALISAVLPMFDKP
jgi:hypothetical protein